MKFPKPWKIERVGRDTYLVTDANDLQLFYIVGVDGVVDGDRDVVLPSALYHSNDGADDAEILVGIEQMLP